MSAAFLQALKAEIGDTERTLRQLNELQRVYQQKQGAGMAAPPPAMLRPNGARAPDGEEAKRLSAPVNAMPVRPPAQQPAPAKPAETAAGGSA